MQFCSSFDSAVVLQRRGVIQLSSRSFVRFRLSSAVATFKLLPATPGAVLQWSSPKGPEDILFCLVDGAGSSGCVNSRSDERPSTPEVIAASARTVFKSNHYRVSVKPVSIKSSLPKDWPTHKALTKAVSERLAIGAWKWGIDGHQMLCWTGLLHS